MKFWTVIGVLSVIAFGGEIKDAWGQSNPILPRPIQPQLPDFPDLPPLPDELKDPTPAFPTFPRDDSPSVTPELSHPAQQFVVQEFKIVGSTVFAQEELQAIADPYLDRPIQIADLQVIRSLLTDLYLKKGFITSGAVLPPDSVSDGVATIEILEGQLARIEITGNDRLHASYIRKRINLGVNQPLNVNRLLKALQTLQVNPLIQSISTELTSSERPGFSVLLVTVVETKTKNLSLNLNNQRSPNIGRFQRRIDFEERNLTGNGDSAFFSYGNTDGSNELDARYELPINARDGSVDISFRQVWSQVIQEPFDQLDLEGRSRNLSIGIRQPLIKNSRQEFAVGAQVSRRESETELLGELAPISPGADENGRTQITGVNVFQEWVKRSRNAVLALRSDFGFGLDLFATNNPTPPDGEFFVWRGQAQYVHQIAPATLLQFRTNLQLSDRSLLSSEQFGLGGAQTVRGYPQNLLLSDNGISGTIEASIPLFQTQERKGLLQVIPFLDVGYGFERSQEIDSSDILFATGFGLRWRWGDRVSAQITWGIPLLAVNTIAPGVGDSQIFFEIDTQLF